MSTIKVNEMEYEALKKCAARQEEMEVEMTAIKEKYAEQLEELTRLRLIGDALERVHVKLRNMEQNWMETDAVNKRQVQLLTTQGTELTYVREQRNTLDARVRELEKNADAKTATEKVKQLETQVAEMTQRLKQAEGTQLFHNNQRLTDENAKLRKLVQAAGPVKSEVKPPLPQVVGNTTPKSIV